MKEIYKDIEGFEKYYQVTDQGRVWSVKNKMFIKLWSNTKGYLRTELYVEGIRTRFLVHRLVMLTFNPIENHTSFEVDHIDNNKQNNRLDNLQWISPQLNLIKRDENRGTLNTKKVFAIKQAWTFEDHNLDSICDKFNISKGQGIDILEDRRWKHVPWPEINQKQVEILF